MITLTFFIAEAAFMLLFFWSLMVINWMDNE